MNLIADVTQFHPVGGGVKRGELPAVMRFKKNGQLIIGQRAARQSAFQNFIDHSSCASPRR